MECLKPVLIAAPRNACTGANLLIKKNGSPVALTAKSNKKQLLRNNACAPYGERSGLFPFPPHPMSSAKDLPTVSDSTECIATLREWLQNKQPAQDLPDALRLNIGRNYPIEIEAHEQNYSVEYIETEPNEDGEGDEDNKYYTFDTLEELASFLFPRA